MNLYYCETCDIFETAPQCHCCKARDLPLGGNLTEVVAENHTVVKPGKTNSKATKRKRQIVYERDFHKCVNCGHEGSDENPLTLDHIVPRSKGGSNEVENLQTMCYDCNYSKGNGDFVPNPPKKRRPRSRSNKRRVKYSNPTNDVTYFVSPCAFDGHIPPSVSVVNGTRMNHRIKHQIVSRWPE